MQKNRIFLRINTDKKELFKSACAAKGGMSKVLIDHIELIIKEYENENRKADKQVIDKGN